MEEKKSLLDLRMVCATHQNLEEKVNNGSFRQTCFIELMYFPINVPTLAERVEDIPLLTSFLLSSLKNNNDLPIIKQDALDALKRHLWPGNIRELKNVLERACILFRGKEVTKSNVMENLLRLKVSI